MAAPIVDPFEAVVLTHPDAPSISVHVLPYGLTIHRLLFVEGPGPSALAGSRQQTHDLIVGPEDPKDHFNARSFFGPIVGRFANRLPSGKSKFTDAQGRKQSIKLPEWGGKGICHHGGPETTDKPAEVPYGKPQPQAGPFDRCVWTPLDDASVQLFQDASHAVAAPGSSKVFGLLSPADSNGFPGTILVEARIAVSPSSGSRMPSDVPRLGSAAGVVRVEYRARLVDGNSADVTPLNLTHHWGFNLSASSPEASAQEAGRIDEHTLRFFGSHVRRLDTDKKGLPTGKLLTPHAGDAHDFVSAGTKGFGRLVREPLAKGGFDHFYVFGAQPQSPSPCALLRSERTGISLSFTSSTSGVQFYSANGQPQAPAPADKSGGRRKRLHEHGGEQQGQGNAERSAAFLEFSHPHGTFLHPEIQRVAGSDTLLYPDAATPHSSWVEVELWSVKGGAVGSAAGAAAAAVAAASGVAIAGRQRADTGQDSGYEPGDERKSSRNGNGATSSAVSSVAGLTQEEKLNGQSNREGLRRRGEMKEVEKIVGGRQSNGAVVRKGRKPLPAAAPGSWEIPRKVFHSSIGFMVLHLYTSHTDLGSIVRGLSIFLGIVVTADVIRLNNDWFEDLYEAVLGHLMRPTEQTKPNGVIWYLVGVITCLHFFPEDIACVSVMILSWADTCASVFGRLFGRYTPKLPSPPFAARKSLAGSIAAAGAGAATAALFWGTPIASIGARASGLSFLGTGSRAVFGTKLTHGFLNSGWTGWAWGFRAREPAAFMADSAASAIVGVAKEVGKVTASGAREALNAVGATKGAGQGIPLWLLCAGTGLVTAIAEALDIGGADDNLTVPVGVSVGLQTMLVLWGRFFA